MKKTQKIINDVEGKKEKIPKVLIYIPRAQNYSIKKHKKNIYEHRNVLG